jgi:hypothetical protein
MSHTFVARLAAHLDIVVDSYTLRPTQIMDCPTTKRKAETRRITEDVNDAQEIVGFFHLNSTTSSTTEQGGEVKNSTNTRPLNRWKNFWRKLRSPKSSS